MAKIWTKIGMIILIIACLFNIVYKLTTRVSFSTEITASVEYFKDIAGRQEKVSENKQK